MKLLFDQNLSARLVGLLIATYPDSDHVRLIGMANDDNEAIWRYAQQHDFIIVSKDIDFFHRSMRFGPPPKVVWVRAGNCTTATVAQLLLSHIDDIIAFVADTEAAFLPIE